MAVSAIRGGRLPIPVFHHRPHHLLSSDNNWLGRRKSFHSNKRFNLFARYSQPQPQDIPSSPSRLQGLLFLSQFHTQTIFLTLFCLKSFLLFYYSKNPMIN